MKNEVQALEILASLPGVRNVRTVKAQSQVKHYSVGCSFETRYKKDLQTLLDTWGFSESELNAETKETEIKFLVRPEEVEKFAETFASLNLPITKKPIKALSMNFGILVTKPIREAIKATLRPGDRISWHGAQAEIILKNCQDIRKVEERLKAKAREMGIEQPELALAERAL